MDNVYGNVVLVEMRVSQWTARKMDKRVAKAVADANSVGEGVGSYYKSLLDPKVVKEIQSIVTTARTYHYKHTLPWSDEGPRVLPTALFMDYSAKIREFRHLFEARVNDLLRDYPFYREEAKRFLGSLFNEDDYPTPEALARKYSFGMRVLPLPKGSDFRCALPDEELGEVRQQLEEENQMMLGRAMKEAFDRVHKVASAFVERLAEPESVFRNTLVENARELADLLPALNVAGDPQLQALELQIRNTLTQHDPEVLRTNEGARTEAYTSAKAVVDQIDSIFGGG